jgi:hypothetical protein
MPRLSPALASVLLLPLATTAQQSIDLDHARRCFQEAKWAADDDAGRLWGRSLYGPTLFFDRATGSVVANQADKDGKLQARDGVFVGTVPNDFAGANTALDWAGVHWTVVLWPLPATTVERVRLIQHESWHRIQDALSLPGASVKNEHLGSKDGRIWLLLEYRALSRALPAWGKERKQALEDALAFRAYRRSLFANAAAEEDRMEVHEGLAEYTGIAASGLDNQAARHLMAGRLKVNALKPALSYAFAYETGPAYGLLLDMQSKTWRQQLTTSSSLSSMLAALAEIDPGKPTLADVMTRVVRYDGEALIAAETAADEQRRAAEAKYRQELVTGPVLTAPLQQRQFTFDPNAVVPLPGEGTVYLGCKFIDEWGILTADGAVLADKVLATVRVPAPASATELHGRGWTLQLNAGWRLVPGKRAGDFTIDKAR